MSSSLLRGVAVALAALLTFSACGGGGGDGDRLANASSTEKDPSKAEAPDLATSPKPADDGSTPAPEGGPEGEDGATGGEGGVDAQGPFGSMTPTPNFPVEASVSPTCVVRGTTAKLSVETKPESGIAYQAVYNGSKGGAPEPFGSGYGGNDNGFADKQGRYTSVWEVSPQAPVGPAYVDVVAGAPHGGWGHVTPKFKVVELPGDC